ncbi:unnamed protein product [Arctogadus glacialis]
MHNGMEQISPKNTDHGKTTTTSKIMDNGKTQQQTKNADIGVETTTRGITDYGTKALYQKVVDADAAAAAAAEMEPLCSTRDDVVLPEDPPTGGAIGLGVGEGTSGDLMPKMAHEGTLVGGGSPRGVGEDNAKGMLSEGEIEETPEEERDQRRKSWMEEMGVETVSETDEPMDRKERKAELVKKRKAKKERIVAKKGLGHARLTRCHRPPI